MSRGSTPHDFAVGQPSEETRFKTGKMVAAWQSTFQDVSVMFSGLSQLCLRNGSSESERDWMGVWLKRCFVFMEDSQNLFMERQGVEEPVAIAWFLWVNAEQVTSDRSPWRCWVQSSVQWVLIDKHSVYRYQETENFFSCFFLFFLSIFFSFFFFLLISKQLFAA